MSIMVDWRVLRAARLLMAASVYPWSAYMPSFVLAISFSLSAMEFFVSEISFVVLSMSTWMSRCLLVSPYFLATDWK